MSIPNIPSFYAIIPAHIRYCKDLEPSAKLLYGELTALASRDGYCWASNEYFAELYNVDERTIRRWLETLKKKGFIDVELNKEGMKTSRKIWISNEIKEMFTKGQKCPGRGDKNVPLEGTKMSAIVLQDTINTLDDDDRVREADPPKIKEEKKSSDEIEVFNTKGEVVKVSVSDVYRVLVKFKPEVLQEAIEKIRNSEGPINDIFKYLKATCESIEKKASYQETKQDFGSKKNKQETKRSNEPPKCTEPGVPMGPLLKQLGIII